MRSFARACSLPAALLVLAALAHDAAALDGQEPGLGPEHRALQRRHAEIEDRLGREQPIGIRKMSSDPSEKFFPEYWLFSEESPSTPHKRREELARDESQLERPRIEDVEESWNASVYGNAFIPPLLLHNDRRPDASLNFLAERRDLHFKRGYQCPRGTSNCGDIGYVNSCCPTDLTCQIIPNTGIGVVGCCPGDDCAGSVSSCDTAHGYSSCPDSQNPNGCCSPGFVCDQVGCVQKSVATVETTLSTTTVTRPGVVTKTIVTTRVITPDGASTVYITHTHPTRTVVISAQGLSTETTVITTTITGTEASPPVRPTSVPDELTTTTGGICPTGYYRCSAFYLGGCCQVGRNCDSTHCPSPVSATILTNNVVTIIVDTGYGVTTITEGNVPPTSTSSPNAITVADTTSTVTQGQGSQDNGSSNCPRAWYTCGSNVGGGCCPNGYGCASSTCSATMAGLPHHVAKVPLDSGGTLSRGLALGLATMAGVLGLGMVWL